MNKTLSDGLPPGVLAAILTIVSARKLKMRLKDVPKQVVQNGDSYHISTVDGGKSIAVLMEPNRDAANIARAKHRQLIDQYEIQRQIADSVWAANDPLAEVKKQAKADATVAARQLDVEIQSLVQQMEQGGEHVRWLIDTDELAKVDLFEIVPVNAKAKNGTKAKSEPKE